MRAALSIFMGTLVLGAVAGWLSTPERGAVAADSSKPEVSPIPARERPAPTTAGLLEDSKAWGKNATEKGGNPYSGEVAKWTDEEIRSALEESLKNRDFLLDTRKARWIASALLAEWMKRDCVAAREWFLTIPPLVRNGMMTIFFARAWPAEHGSEGLAFVKANPQVFENVSPWPILVKNVEASAAGGPASVIELIGELDKLKLRIPSEDQASFPEHFDFSGLVKSPEMLALLKSGHGKFFLSAWYAQDRDACFDWVIRDGDVSDLTAMVATEAEKSLDGVHWLGAKYEAMSPDQRQSMEWRIPAGSPEFILDLSAGIRNEAAADTLRSVSADWVFRGKVAEAMEVLGTMKDPARRVEALEKSDRGQIRSRGRREDFRPLTEGDEQILRRHLQEWNATPEQTVAIVSKFQHAK